MSSMQKTLNQLGGRQRRCFETRIIKKDRY